MPKAWTTCALEIHAILLQWDKSSGFAQFKRRVKLIRPFACYGYDSDMGIFSWVLVLTVILASLKIFLTQL